MPKSTLLPALALAVLAALIAPAAQATCRAAHLCREGAPGGKLKNSHSTWSSPCGPNGEKGGTDPICKDITSCSTAGAFGKFLDAVTGNCRGKTFDGYYGLDGLTFGILDFTSNELATLFEMAKKDAHTSAKFDEIFKDSGIKMNGSCLDPTWTCNANKNGDLNCDAKFRPAFEKFVTDPDMQKVQLALAVKQYQQRIARFKPLGLKTQYGLVAMAVVANNLRSTPGCKPATWKQKCAGKADEGAMVDCMLHEYGENACRHTKEGSISRAKTIMKTFEGHKNDRYSDPDVSGIAACSTQWGSGSGSRAPRATHSAPKTKAKH